MIPNIRDDGWSILHAKLRARVVSSVEGEPEDWRERFRVRVEYKNMESGKSAFFDTYCRHESLWSLLHHNSMEAAIMLGLADKEEASDDD